MKNFIHFRGKGDHFSLFVNERGALCESGSNTLDYIDDQEGEFSFFYSTGHYDLPLLGQWLKLDELPALEGNQGAMLCRALGAFWSFMPGHMNGLTATDLPMQYGLKDNSLKTLTFFGGSFFPWHEGHRECVDQAWEQGRNVIVVPDHNPWKNKERRSCYWASYRQICDRLKDTPHSVYPGFWGLDRVNPTVRWLPLVELEQRSLLMGDDSFFDLHLWEDVENLLNCLDSIFVIPRQGKTKQRELQKELLSRFNPNLKFFFLDRHPYEKISSTSIRQKWRRKVEEES